MRTTSCNIKHLFIVHTTYLCVSFFTAEGGYFIQYQARLGLYKGYISRKRSHAAKVSAVKFYICISIKLCSSCKLEYDINNKLGPDHTYFGRILYRC